jgi:sugar phosphate isomerase/epimerase
MTDYDRYNDGSQHPPRLRVQHSLWSLIGLPMNAPEEWTLMEKLTKVKEAGFEAVECWLDESNEQQHKDALNAAGLRLVLGHNPSTLDDARAIAAQATRLGADFAFSHPLNPYVPMAEAAAFLRAAQRIVNDAGVAYFVETHRGNIPESLNQALALIELMPEVRFTGDLSHAVVIGEFYGWEDERAIDRLDPILQRVSHLHGRISNGEQIQVDVGDGSGETAQFFVKLWARAMFHWRSGAGPGDIFPFASELGPPRYAITLPDGSEFSDRWAQSLVMKQLAEQAWELSAGG